MLAHNRNTAILQILRQKANLYDDCRDL